MRGRDGTGRRHHDAQRIGQFAAGVTEDGEREFVGLVGNRLLVGLLRAHGDQGNADLLMTLRTYSVAQLANITDRIRSIVGVEEVTSWAHLDIVKETYRAGFAH